MAHPTPTTRHALSHTGWPALGPLNWAAHSLLWALVLLLGPRTGQAQWPRCPVFAYFLFHVQNVCVGVVPGFVGHEAPMRRQHFPSQAGAHLPVGGGARNSTQSFHVWAGTRGRAGGGEAAGPGGPMSNRKSGAAPGIPVCPACPTCGGLWSPSWSPGSGLPPTCPRMHPQANGRAS